MRIIIIYIFLTLLFTDFSYISKVSKAAKELVTQQIKDVYNFGHTIHRTVDEELGIAHDEKFAPDAVIQKHSPQSLDDAVLCAKGVPNIFGLIYKEEKPMYDDIVLNSVKNAEKKSIDSLLDGYVI